MKVLPGIALLSALWRLSLAYSPLSDDTLLALQSPGSAFDIHTGEILAPILQPRVPGTAGSQAVLFHFVDWFSTNLPRWKLTFQNSSSVTPTSGASKVPFTNLIATRDPPWVQQEGDVGRLALVAHYDSKIEPEGFIGAIDSAAPCAMIMHAAQSIDAALTRKWDAMMLSGVGSGFDDFEEHRGVQILLLDGEEAFLEWSDTDSIYGARALAKEWDATPYSPMSNYRTPLASIELFVLLDLLGVANPTIPSFFKTTHWAYKRMADIERRMRDLGKFKSKSGTIFKDANKSERDFWAGGMVQDDHVPFMDAGVEVLHLIPLPFPPIWHTIDDDAEHLDADTVEDFAVLTAAFAAEWLELDGHFDTRRLIKRPRTLEKSEL